MSNNVTLSLPLSATALRLGATLLTDLASHTETIHAELSGRNYQLETYVAGVLADGLGGAQDPQPEQFGTISEVSVVQEEQADPGCAIAETPEQRQYRLHGNVASAGMEPAPGITQETLPPVEYETVVIGYAQGPTPFADGHDQTSYEAAGWDIAALLNAGHLVEVTEQRPLAVAPGASAAPSAPAPAPAPVAPAPTGAGVQLDKDGLPWDSRIHSDAAEKLTKTGVWKTRKNLPDGYKAQIEAELRAVMNAGKPASGAPAPGTVTTATVAPTPSPAPAPSAAPAPTPNVAPAPAPAAPPAAAGNPFATFTRWLVDNTKSGKLSQTDAVLEIQKQGLSSLPDLAKRPDLIPVVMAALTAAKGL